MTYEEALASYEYDCNECRYAYCNDCQMNLVIKALEKQIPQKPINAIRRLNGWYAECPVCGGKIIKAHEYCQSCGTKMDWQNISEMVVKK